MHQEIESLWGRPVSSLPTYIDLGRLCKRIDVYIENGSEEAGSSSTAQAEEDGGVAAEPLIDQSISLEFKQPVNTRSESRAQDLANAIRAVVLKLEPPEVVAKLPIVLDKFVADAGDNLDYRVYIQELFEALFEDMENSRSVKIFKLVNQAALFIAIMEMKSLVMATRTTLKPEELMTKDVRTPDGWRIEINITPTEITVAHIRKDQCLGPPLCPDIWNVKWRFCVSFTRDMSQMTRSEVRILDMSFGPAIPTQLASELKRVYYESINQDFSYSESAKLVTYENSESIVCCC